MHTWIALDSDDSWRARYDKHARLAEFPQPLYVLAGPGFYDVERFLLISDTAWTPETVRATLTEIYGPIEAWDDDPTDQTRYAKWVQTWLHQLSLAGSRS